MNVEILKNNNNNYEYTSILYRLHFLFILQLYDIYIHTIHIIFYDVKSLAGFCDKYILYMTCYYIACEFVKQKIHAIIL